MSLVYRTLISGYWVAALFLGGVAYADASPAPEAAAANAEVVRSDVAPGPQDVALAPAGEEDPALITLDVKNMDIVELLQVLASRAGLNIVIASGVSGRATVFLKDVRTWEAFESVLLENGLAYERSGAIISVMPQKDFEMRHGTRFLDKTDTVVFDLNYARAEGLKERLKEVLTPGIGSLQVDERTNRIAVTDHPEKMVRLAKLISAFDIRTPQVLIDAQVIEINPSDKFEMGVDWDYWLKKNFRLASALPTAGALNKLTFGTAAAGKLVGEEGEYKGIIDMLRTIGDTKILSSPRIMALNNQEAKILVGTKEAYITSTISQGGAGTAVTSQNVNFVDVGIKLYVTPSISHDSFVTMKIRPEISSAQRLKILSDGKETEVPIVTTSEAETAVTVKDGVTILIGGLRKDQRTKTVKKVPLLGDIPLLGFFFRNTSDSVTRSELVILLTPHLTTGERAFSDVDPIVPEAGVVARMVNGDIVTDQYPPKVDQQKKIRKKVEVDMVD